MTIRLRLTLIFVVLVALLLGLRELVADQGFRKALMNEARAEVLGRERDVAAYLQLMAEQQPRPSALPPDSPEWLPRTFYDDGMHVQVRRPDGRLLLANASQAEPWPLTAAGVSATSMTVGGHTVPALLATRELTLAGIGPVVLQVGYPLQRVESALARNRQVDLMVAALALAFAFAAGYFLAGRALAPAAALNARIETLAATDLTQRLPTPAVPRDEMERLAATFNRMLGRIEASFDAQRRFVADASHELRSPLTAIQGHLELIAKRGEAHPEQARHWLKLASGETARLSRMVEELLFLARTDAGAERPVLEPLALKPVVLQVIGALAPLHERLAAGPLQELQVRGDASQLSRLLYNLVDNALKATQEDGEVLVSLERDGGEAVLRVVDSGLGIAPEAMPHLFERFFRADAARARKRGGAGLGLAICQAIVEAHGGRIRVESRLGEGTTFEVRLALA